MTEAGKGREIRPIDVATGAAVLLLVAALGADGLAAWKAVGFGLLASGVVTFALLLLDTKTQEDFSAARIEYRKSGEARFPVANFAVQCGELAAAWAVGRMGFVLVGAVAIAAAHVSVELAINWRRGHAR